MKQNTFSQQHKVYAPAVILYSTIGNYNQLTVVKVGKNAFTEFLDVLLEWETRLWRSSGRIGR